MCIRDRWCNGRTLWARHTSVSLRVVGKGMVVKTVGLKYVVHYDIAKFLLENEALVNYRANPLIVAARNGQAARVELLCACCMASQYLSDKGRHVTWNLILYWFTSTCLCNSKSISQHSSSSSCWHSCLIFSCNFYKKKLTLLTCVGQVYILIYQLVLCISCLSGMSWHWIWLDHGMTWYTKRVDCEVGRPHTLTSVYAMFCKHLHWSKGTNQAQSSNIRVNMTWNQQVEVIQDPTKPSLLNYLLRLVHLTGVSVHVT